MRKEHHEPGSDEGGSTCPPTDQPIKPGILVIDDEREICELLAAYFKHHGVHVTTAMTAEEARQHMARDEFGLVIVDWHLGGTAGLDLIIVSKESHPATPVIVYTGVDGVDIALVNEAVSGRADAVVRKQGSLKELWSEVFRLLIGVN